MAYFKIKLLTLAENFQEKQLNFFCWGGDHCAEIRNLALANIKGSVNHVVSSVILSLLATSYVTSGISILVNKKINRRRKKQKGKDSTILGIETKKWIEA
jgi:hypothetical protein